MEVSRALHCWYQAQNERIRDSFAGSLDVMQLQSRSQEKGDVDLHHA